MKIVYICDISEPLTSEWTTVSDVPASYVSVVDFIDEQTKLENSWRTDNEITVYEQYASKIVEEITAVLNSIYIKVEQCQIQQRYFWECEL